MPAQPAATTASTTTTTGRLGSLDRLRRLANAAPVPSPLAMRRIALAGLIASAVIIPSGGAVRLSESGLGCTTWPKCTSASLVASGASGGMLVHRWVEFGNRLVTVAITVLAIAVFLAAWRFASHRAPVRRDLIWLAAAQPAGIAAQAVIGGIVVLTNLSPFWVSLHYLATLPVLAAAVVLHVRCGEGTSRPQPLAAPPGCADPGGRPPATLVRVVARALLAITSVIMVVGTLVTGTGPLAGAGSAPRYHFASLRAITELHADIGWVLVTVAVMLVLAMRYLPDSPPRARRLGWIVLGLIGLQGVVGYAQYFAGLPAGLVWVHVANTALIWIAVIRLNLALRDRGQLL